MIMIIVLEFVFYFVLIGLLLSWRTLTLALHLCFITSALHQCFITLRFALPHSYACSDIATRRTKTCCPRLSFDSCPGVFVSTPSMESPALAPSTRIPLRRVCS